MPRILCGWLFWFAAIGYSLIEQNAVQAQPVSQDTIPVKRKLVLETWETAYIQGQKAGYVHFTVHQENRNGQAVFIGWKELRLTIARDGQRAVIEADSSTEETEDGEVIAIRGRQTLGKSQSLIRHGQLEDGIMKIRTEGPTTSVREIRWGSNVVGLVREQKLLAERKVRPGDEFHYVFYEPTVNHNVRIQVKVKDIVEMALRTGQPKQKLLRVEAKPEKIGDLQLPGSVIWCDPQSWEVLRTDSELPGLGILSLIRSTKEEALGETGTVPDLISQQSIRLDRAIPRIHDLAAVTLKIHLKDENVASVFAVGAQENRQQLVQAKQLTPEEGFVEIRLLGIRQPIAVESPMTDPEKEFLESNRFINSADARVKQLAHQATLQAKTPLQKARAIERWVRQNMRALNYTEAMATADHVARTLEGDCSEFAMLTAAMLRAQGIPSRTAMGLVYAEDRRGPMLAYHMWTEAWIDGQWFSLDATLGKGFIGPGHLKITDHSWAGIDSFKPLLPITRALLAKPRAEIVQVSER